MDRICTNNSVVHYHRQIPHIWPDTYVIKVLYLPHRGSAIESTAVCLLLVQFDIAQTKPITFPDELIRLAK